MGRPTLFSNCRTVRWANRPLHPTTTGSRALVPPGWARTSIKFADILGLGWTRDIPYGFQRCQNDHDTFSLSLHLLVVECARNWVKCRFVKTNWAKSSKNHFSVCKPDA